MRSPRPDQIQGFRLQAGHSQAQAAALVQVARITWIKWESGEHPMPAGLWLLYVFQCRYSEIWSRLMRYYTFDGEYERLPDPRNAWHAKDRRE